MSTKPREQKRESPTGAQNALSPQRESVQRRPSLDSPLLSVDEMANVQLSDPWPEQKPPSKVKRYLTDGDTLYGIQSGVTTRSSSSVGQLPEKKKGRRKRTYGSLNGFFNLFRKATYDTPLSDSRHARLIARNPGGKVQVEYENVEKSYKYLYHSLIDWKWQNLFLAFGVTFIIFNFIFAAIYSIVPSSIRRGDEIGVGFMNAFFFSLQTSDTIGYGNLGPNGHFGNWIVVLESITANLFFIVWTGLIFAKVSRPSRIRYSVQFSEVAVLNRNEPVFEGGEAKGSYLKTGCPSITFRLADKRPSAVICDSDFHLLSFMRTLNDRDEWEFITHELDFEINRQRGRNRTMSMSVPLLAIPWKVVHKIDENSPLYGKSVQDMKAEWGEIIAVMDGIDEACSENYQARWSYVAEEIVQGAEFVPCMHVERKGQQLGVFHVDLTKLSITRQVKSARHTV